MSAVSVISQLFIGVSFGYINYVITMNITFRLEYQFAINSVINFVILLLMASYKLLLEIWNLIDISKQLQHPYFDVGKRFQTQQTVLIDYQHYKYKILNLTFGKSLNIYPVCKETSFGNALFFIQCKYNDSLHFCNK